MWGAEGSLAEGTLLQVMAVGFSVPIPVEFGATVIMGGPMFLIEAEVPRNLTDTQRPAGARWFWVWLGKDWGCWWGLEESLQAPKLPSVFLSPMGLSFHTVPMCMS